MTVGACYSVWMTVWYAGAYAPPYQTVIYFFSLHVLGYSMPIIRRNICICGTLGTCYSVWMTVWHAGWNETVSFHPEYQTVIHTE